jgi:hypothetical protein
MKKWMTSHQIVMPRAKADENVLAGLNQFQSLLKKLSSLLAQVYLGSLVHDT